MVKPPPSSNWANFKVEIIALPSPVFTVSKMEISQDCLVPIPVLNYIAKNFCLLSNQNSPCATLRLLLLAILLCTTRKSLA